MDGAISITVANSYLVDLVYRRIVGELKRRGEVVDVSVVGNVIRIPKTDGVREVVWNVVKSTPTAVFSSIDVKV